MNISINPLRCLQSWLDKHPRAKEWGWFITLWLGGLMTVTIATYPIKWLIKRLS